MQGCHEVSPKSLAPYQMRWLEAVHIVTLQMFMPDRPFYLSLHMLGLISFILVYIQVLSFTGAYQAALSLFSLFLLFCSLMSSEDPVETTSIEVEGTESQQCRVSIVLNGKLLDDMDFLLSPWPKMDMTVDDTFNLDVEQYDQPPELRLLLDEKQTPAEVRDILLNSLQVPGEEVVSGSQDPNFADDQIQNPKIEEGSGNGESSRSLLRSSSEYQGHSPSTSTTSLSLSTVPTAGSSDDSIRQGSRKPALSALVSSTANFFESVKHAMKDSPTDKKGKSATSRKVYECPSLSIKHDTILRKEI